MRKDIADKWVAALRSGEYKQRKFYLASPGPFVESGLQYCCLGVLCEIAIKEGVKLNRVETTIISPVAYGANEETKYLPSEVKDWAMMWNTSGALKDGSYRDLAALNDEGFSFEQIADAIEKNWELL